MISVDNPDVAAVNLHFFQGASFGKHNDRMHWNLLSEKGRQVLDVGAILHNGIIKMLLVASVSAGGQCLVPVPLLLTAENPATVIFAFRKLQYQVEHFIC